MNNHQNTTENDIIKDGVAPKSDTAAHLLSQQTPSNGRISLFDDILLLGIMAVLAGCGLIYEYLLSHYAGRILGALEAAIYTMIGLMIVSMGIGAFAARTIRCPFTGFVLLELTVALCGSLAIIVTAAVIGFSQQLPLIVATTLGLPPDLYPDGGAFSLFQQLSTYLPYLWGVILGLMIGMEIPLIARVRQSLCAKHLQHNAGTIYGADYIGAGVGAAIWVAFMLALEIQLAAALTASFNLLAGFIFIWRFWNRIRWVKLLLVGHILVAAMVALLAHKGPIWEEEFNNLLYKDEVIYSKATRFQQLTFTQRLRGNDLAPVYSLYINGRLQFSSLDEHIYHRFLVHPALQVSARQKKILIIGGGDGLALKEVLRWNPQSVTLIDLDRELLALFSQQQTDSSQQQTDMPAHLSQTLLALNANSLNDSRVNIVVDDAFNGVDKLINNSDKFDAIIVDLPDPSHPDLNKLYSDLFYKKLRELLSADGAITVQSTSPYHAPKAFISIGKTLELAGFNVDQFHHNVPSFGQWGWSIATLFGKGAKQRLAQTTALTIEDDWLTLGLMQASFEFPANFYTKHGTVKANQIGSMQLYQYHLEAWSESQGLTLF